MSKVLLIGDVHLSKGVNIGRPNINGLNSRIIDQIKLLDWCLDVAIDKNIHDIILLGDIFEHYEAGHRIINLFIEWLKKVELENINCYILLGNHDLQRNSSLIHSPLDIIFKLDFEHIYFYKTTSTVELQDTSITFLPFRDRRTLNKETIQEAINYLDELLQFEVLGMDPLKTKVLVGHMTPEKSLYISDEIDDQINEIILPLSVFRNYEYCFFGHIHKPQILQQKTKILPHIEIAGSLDISDFGEANNIKNIILFDTDSLDKIERIPVPSRPLRILKVLVDKNITDSTQHVIDAILQHNENYPYKNAIVKVEITLNGQEISGTSKKQIEEVIYNLGAFHITNITESRNIAVISTEQKEIMANTIEPKSAVKLFAETQKFESDVEKNEFILLCNTIIDECKSSNKGN